MTFSQQKGEARRVCSLLGHRLGRWVRDPGHPSVSFALCDGCFDAVQVDAEPKRPYLAVTGLAYTEVCMHPGRESAPDTARPRERIPEY